MTKFIHLRNHTEYSLCKGAIKIKKLVSYLKDNNIPAVAITDSHTMFGVLEFSMACMKEGIQPIVGCEMVLNLNSFLFPNQKRFFSIKEEEENFAKIVLIAKTDIGYLNLMSLLSNSYLNRKTGLTPHILLDNLLNKKEGLIILSGGINGCFEKQLIKEQFEKAENILNLFKDQFPDDFYIEIQRHALAIEIKYEDKIIDLAYKFNIPLVATNDCYFMKKTMFEAQDALSCIASSRYISEKDRERLTPEHYLKTENEMLDLFIDLPEAIENTINITRKISTMSYKRKPTLPHYPTDDSLKQTQKEAILYELFPEFNLKDNDYLEPKIVNDPEKDKNIKINFDEAVELIKLSKIGLEERIEKKFIVDKINSIEEQKKIRKLYFDQLIFELKVIIQMDFPGYFLIVSDFIIWSKYNDVPIGPGRGSGAGSVVSWSLKITDLDPIKFSLFFERFLNPERVSMPDFDIDLCQRGRHKTIEYVQNKYGKEMVAQIITFGKLQAKAVIKDVGRVLQMGYSEVDKISKMIPFNTDLEEALKMDPELQKQREEDYQINKLIEIALQLEGLNRHSSVHAAGVVIGDKPLEQICPLFFDDGAEMPVVQYTMKYVEEVGLVKFDFLGLKTLTVIKDAIQYIKNIRNLDIIIEDIDLEDQNIFEMLKKADSVGVFQIESTGMRGMLKQIKPDNIEDIIALISLYRPGPMDSIPTYVRRKHDIEDIEYPHEKVKQILKDTYGIIIYQEQVMDMAKILAGYTLGGADLLRRAMGKKIKKEMDEQREVFVKGCNKFSNINPVKANEIFDLLAKFAEYGFNKAHAASYAVIGFQTAYLKRYYPVEFFVATINIELHDTDKINFYLEDIKKHDIKIIPPDINISEAYFSIELVPLKGRKSLKVDKYFKDKELAIRYSLSAIKGVGLEIIFDLMKEREKNGKFKNIFDFCSRMGSKIVNKKTMESLSRSGAFDSIHPNRRQIFESCEILSAYAKTEEEIKNSLQMDLFSVFGEEQKIYPKLQNVEDWYGYERFQREFESFGFYLQNHPMDEKRDEFEKYGISSLKDIFNDEIRDGAIVRLAGVVISTTIKSSDKGRYAFISISDPTGLIELSLFNNDLITQRKSWLDDKEHMQLVFECNILKKDESDPRFIIRDFWLLDSYLKDDENRNIEKVRFIKKRDFSSFNFKKNENKSENFQLKEEKIFEKINVVINSHRALGELREILDKSKNKNVKTTQIIINIDDQQIQLPNIYSIDVIMFNRVRNLYGVERVDV